MSGGIWTLQDKIRPGAYVNFSSTSYWTQNVAGKGVVTMALEMDWGPEKEIIELDAADVLSREMTGKIGYSADHQKALPVSEALQNCRKVLLYRVNGLATKAQAQLGTLAVTAKYGGTRGNDISVSVTKATATNDFVVVTYVDGAEVDRKNVAASQALTDNDWVEFQLDGDLTPTVATALTGGSNGHVCTGDYDDYFQLMRGQDWQVMALPSPDESLAVLLKDYIYDLRENCGRKVQGVAYNYAADYEGIITVEQGYTRRGLEVSPHIFVAWVAGVTAGAEAVESNTYRVIDAAQGIIGELSATEIEGKLRQGYFLITRRTDGTIVVEQDVNSLVSYGGHKSEVFHKNRVIRTLDSIANGLTNMFEVNYIGTIDNNAEGRDLFKQDIIHFMEELMGIGAIRDFVGADDVMVKVGKNADSVLVNLAVCPVDAMEKLYLTVEVNP